MVNQTVSETLACFFVSDLHGHIDRYNKLFSAIEAERPAAVFIGGDMLPNGLKSFGLPGAGGERTDFIHDFLAKEFGKLKEALGDEYPRVFVILGNDDPRFHEASMLDVAALGLWDYMHDRHVEWLDFTVYGYAFVPPTPFRLKDWERFDVSRYVDPGAVAPEEGMFSVPVKDYDIKFGNIAEGLRELTDARDVTRSIFLFHSPPYKSKLDRAALDGTMVDHAPVDVHVGSIAIQRFIEDKQPLLTLHGHVHESTRITGQWRDKIGATHMFNAAHAGPELSLVRFDPSRLDAAVRELV